jgi:hypothetical protein
MLMRRKVLLKSTKIKRSKIWRKLIKKNGIREEEDKEKCVIYRKLEDLNGFKNYNGKLNNREVYNSADGRNVRTGIYKWANTSGERTWGICGSENNAQGEQLEIFINSKWACNDLPEQSPLHQI